MSGTPVGYLVGEGEGANYVGGKESERGEGEEGKRKRGIGSGVSGGGDGGWGGHFSVHFIALFIPFYRSSWSFARV